MECFLSSAAPLIVSGLVTVVAARRSPGCAHIWGESKKKLMARDKDKVIT